jgi:hypothetical protein
MQYRIETVTWSSDVTPAERAKEICTLLADYDPEWALVQIGAPGEGTVPITFHRRASPPTAAETTE